MVQVEMNNMYINIGANNGGEKFEQKKTPLPSDSTLRYSTSIQMCRKCTSLVTES